MDQDPRIDIIRGLLDDYVKSPSLRHLRDPYSITKLAKAIVRRLARSTSIWTKWNEPRELLVKSATECWIPVDDLRDHLNNMDGPPLTSTDVEQRLRAFREEPYSHYPNEELHEGCETLYRREKLAGTELPAIIGAMEEFIYLEEQRLREEWEVQRQVRIRDEKAALEQRFLSGADCKWMPIKDSKELYCRMNGRIYRLLCTKDKRFELCRVQSIDEAKGTMVGIYLTRGDASKALKQVAYQPEPRW